MAHAVVSQVNTRTGALRAPAYPRPRSQSPTYILTSSATEVAHMWRNLVVRFRHTSGRRNNDSRSEST